MLKNYSETTTLVHELFPADNKQIEVRFSGDDISSDGGLLLLREVDNQMGLINRISNCITDNRDQRYVDHTISEMLTQRVTQILYQTGMPKLQVYELIRLEQVYCNPERNLTQDKLMMIADCGFIERAENILITGKTGCGKSYLACAIGRQACTLGYRTLYFGINRFLEKITLSKLDGTYIKLLNQIEKAHLIIIDDFGLHPLYGTTRRAVLQILEDRYGIKSTIIVSQLPVANWYEYIGETTISDAIMDRLSGNAHRIDLEGDTLRNKT